MLMFCPMMHCHTCTRVRNHARTKTPVHAVLPASTFAVSSTRAYIHIFGIHLQITECQRVLGGGYRPVSRPPPKGPLVVNASTGFFMDSSGVPFFPTGYSRTNEGIPFVPVRLLPTRVQH